MPEITFDNRLEIDLGGVTCIVQYVGGDHAPDSVIVYIKEEKILFLADCIYPNMYAPKENYTIKETLRLLEVLESFDAVTYIPSHQHPISKEEFQQEVNMLRTIANYTDVFGGNKQKIIEEYEKRVKRDLTENERVTIEDFVNGY